MSITVVAWRWLSPNGYRSTFGPETVYALREMVKRHLHMPHRFVCCTDRPKELPGIETLPIWEEALAIPPPNGRHNPSCYARLKVFAPDAGKVFGERLVSIDLDTVIVNDITPLFETDAEFRIWGETVSERKRWGESGKQYYNGSLFLLKTGTRTQVWTKFDPARSPALALRAGCFGSDQGWISYILGPKEETWGRKDGIYSYRKHLAPAGDILPENARVCIFHGKVDPWSYRASHVDWIRKHYPTYDKSWVAA